MPVRRLPVHPDLDQLHLGRDRIIRLLHDHGARDLESAAGRAALQGKTETVHMICDLAGRPPLEKLSLAGPA